MVRLSVIIIIIIFFFNKAYGQQDSIYEMGYPFVEVPKFEGDLRIFVKKNIVYPKSAVIDSIEGKVFVSYMVDTIGYTYKHTVEKGIRDDLNAEAIRVAKLIKYDSPAKHNDKPVPFFYTLPIEFKFPKNMDNKKISTDKICNEQLKE